MVCPPLTMSETFGGSDSNCARGGLPLIQGEYKWA
jgi:hypothetical protein